MTFSNKNLFMLRSSVLSMGLVFTSTVISAVIPGGDYSGADLMPADGDILSGAFTNVGTFHIAAGSTVYVAPGVALSIEADTIDIDGVLDGVGTGYEGGVSVPNIETECSPDETVEGLPGDGPSGGGGGLFGCNVHGSGGGGGGYGGAGGNSGSFFNVGEPGAAPGGMMYGNATSLAVEMGSGGGSGSRYNMDGGSSGAGGNGGGSVTLMGATDVDGAILVDGYSGDPGVPDSPGIGTPAGGGGSGGGVLIYGNMSLAGAISATGGGGGDPEDIWFSSAGGGGAGGRVKLFGCMDYISSAFFVDVAGGAAGTDAGDILATDGGDGTFADETAGVCGLSKSLVSGPDVDGDGNIDLAVEVGTENASMYDFEIRYNDIFGPPVLILDTVPAEWDVMDDLPSDTLNCELISGNKKDNGKSATKIACLPDSDQGVATFWAETRCHGNRNNSKCRPTSCGGLYLNEGAAAYELDLATGEPAEEPLFTSSPLCLAAVEDLDGNGIDPSGGGDEDSDGISDLVEACRLGTDPCVADTDGDGLPDNVDACPLEAPVFDDDADGCEDELE